LKLIVTNHHFLVELLMNKCRKRVRGKLVGVVRTVVPGNAADARTMASAEQDTALHRLHRFG
jgi:hypothetical protein